uniref:Peritrophin type-A domain protein 1 n=1 Tax=Mamestra configurata TaxID=174822 RepID=D5KU16_9NEOP|nr:peritrophin type-A domain protein 1 [Mamestra configurata]
MIAKFLTTVLLLNVVLTAEIPQKNATETAKFRVFENVDPNDLSCDPAGHIFLLLPHFTDCSKFYMCAHGEEVEFQCPGGLIFDFQLQTCNWAWDTTCQLRTPQDEDEGSGDEADSLIGIFTDELEHQPVDTVASVRPISPMQGRYNGIINCARADAAARQVPYKGDCQRYWKCVAGVPQVAFCSDGLFFNEHTQQCDFEANSKCVLSQEDELQSEFIKYEQ